MKHHFIPIWFFIGILLAVYGVLIMGAGIYDWIHPVDRGIALAGLHAPIWWGGLLLVLGLVYALKFRPDRS